MSAGPINPSPNPAPSGATNLMGALTGPILLTTLGTLLTIDYMGSASIGRTWPVLLIVFGLCKILNYGSSRAA